jgi:predicted amidohydrolase
MKVSLIQHDVLPDWDRHLQNLSAAIDEAAPNHDLVCLPELFHANYADLPGAALSSGSARTKELARLSKVHPGALLVGSVAWRTGGTLANTLVLILDGQVMPFYQKVHLFPPMGEPVLFTAGRRLAVLDLIVRSARWRVGFAICYDLRFPELFRILAAVGCQLVVVPAQWPAARIKAWRTLLEARAVENQLFVAGINRCGKDDKESFGGYSRLISPTGEVVASATQSPAIASAILESRLVDQSRAFNHSQKHCRSDLYRLRWLGEVETREITLGS